jgi:ferritin-like metal-binding protein YciE
LADVYDAEKQLTKAVPKMAEACEDDTLRDGFENCETAINVGESDEEHAGHGG